MPVATPSRPHLVVLSVLVAALAVSGCRSRGEEVDFKGSAESIHRDAREDIRSSNYPAAIQRLELLEARFPFSDVAKQGQLDLLYAYYRNREAESAIDQADQFIRENPTHPRVDYAYYIKGLVYFESGASYLERLFKADIAKRPPQEARKAFQSFQTLVQQYPRSPYAADSRQRMIYLRNRLADYEVSVARYYMKRGAYVGAANRARNVVEGFDGSPAVVEALAIMADAYRKLGMNDVAMVADNVRSANALPDTVSTAAASGAGMAMSQDGGGPMISGEPARVGRWEGRVGVVSANSADVDFEGGTTAEIDGGIGFTAGVQYHYTDRIQFGSTFTYDQKDYSAELVGDQPDPYPIEGSLDSMTLMADATYNFLTGPLTPFVSAGIGWSWVDTNIKTEPPEVGCWWHPWWGYICTSYQNTKTFDGLAYEVGVGMRYDFSHYFAVDGSYRMKWVDFENATDTPSFDGFQLNVGWKF